MRSLANTKSASFPDYRWIDEQPLEPRRRKGKSKEMEEITKNLPGKEVLLIGDSITKNLERFALRYTDFFPASTVLNAGIAGDTVEAVLYRVESMNIPSSVSHISLLCGTNNLSQNSPATISSTFIEILFCLRSKCPNAYILIFVLIIFQLMFLILTLLFILRFRIFFQTLWFATSCHHPCTTETCTGMINFT